MNIRKKFVLVIICLLAFLFGYGQQRIQVGLMPMVNLNKKLKDGYKLNFKTENRQIFYSKENFNFNYQLTDFSLITSKKVGLNNALAGGYLMRFREREDLIHRFIQQFTIVQSNALRLAHRFSTDQTFGSSEPLELRVRYRVVAQLSLNGQQLDNKEFYLKLGNEYLNSLQEEEYDLEVRFTAFLGYVITDNNKVEFGIDNRFDSFIFDKLRYRSWVNLGWYLAL